MSGSGKSILVTGGGGYIGSHTIVELLKEDFEVIVVDNFVNSIKGKQDQTIDYCQLNSSRPGLVNFINAKPFKCQMRAFSISICI